VRPNPILPRPGFMLAFLCGGLLLLCYELRLETHGTGVGSCQNWVLLERGERGRRFLSAPPGEKLGKFVNSLFPGGEIFVPEPCQKVLLEPGLQIIAEDQSIARPSRCVVRSAPEGFRYLLGLPVNINRATEAELSLLPGVGPTLASRIFRAREARGDFLSPAALIRVRGIGKKLAEKILRRATLDPGTACICPAQGLP